MRKPITTFALAIVCCQPFHQAQAQAPAPVSVVQTANAEQRDLAPTMWIPGTVISRADAHIGSEISGILATVVDVGEHVEQGQPLGKIRDRQLTLQLARDEAELKRLKKQYAHAQKQYNRTLTLSQANNAAQAQLDELKMTRDDLALQINLAEIQLAQTEYLNQQTVIAAPFTGVVAQRFAQAGEHIAVGEELVRLVSTDDVEVSIKAPVGITPFIAAGQEVRVKNKRDESTSSIRSVIPISDTHSRMFELRVTLDDHHWVIGEAVDVAVNNGAQISATVVPRDALVLRSDEVYIFRIKEGKAEKVIVTLGLGDSDSIAVTGDIAPGDQIVTRGAERLADGNEVNVIKTLASH